MAGEEKWVAEALVNIGLIVGGASILGAGWWLLDSGITGLLGQAGVRLPWMGN